MTISTYFQRHRVRTFLWICVAWFFADFLEHAEGTDVKFDDATTTESDNDFVRLVIRVTLDESGRLLYGLVTFPDHMETFHLIHVKPVTCCSTMGAMTI